MVLTMGSTSGVGSSGRRLKAKPTEAVMFIHRVAVRHDDSPAQARPRFNKQGAHIGNWTRFPETGIVLARRNVSPPCRRVSELRAPLPRRNCRLTPFTLWWIIRYDGSIVKLLAAGRQALGTDAACTLAGPKG
jgi:hypothetical protein